MNKDMIYRNKNIFIALIWPLIFIILVSGIVHAALPVIMGDHGSDVRSIATGELLPLGNLTIRIYDDPVAGNLIYENNFTDVILNGSWNVMLYNVSLDFGRDYYKDYSINGDDLDFSGEERLAFTSSLGEINISSNITLGQKIMFSLGAFIRNIVPGWLQIDSSVNVSEDLEVSGNTNIVGNLTVGGVDVCLSNGVNCLANVSGNTTYIYNNFTTNYTYNITNNITYNITQNFTSNYTNNYYTNISYNITNNITYYTNFTNNITYNTTYNLTYNITNNITTYINNTYNVTNNITEYVNITYNITQNITYNVTQNITYNVTYNITNNITQYVNNTYNITNNITYNITQNITYNITNNFTEYLNVTYNLTNNVTTYVNNTFNITNNITFNITQNVTYNVTYNITNNITNNITQYVNNTYNITNNLTQNITYNITNNITFNITNNLTFNVTQNFTYNITYNITNNITTNITYNITNNLSLANSSYQCSGTDKLVNISIINGVVYGVCQVDQTGTGGGISTVQSLNTSLINVANGSYTNLTVNLSGFDGRYMQYGDQRYNDTVRINAVNSSVNIQSLGFNTTANLKSYFDSLYYSLGNPFGFLNVSGVVSAVGNWSADKSAYNTTVQLDSRYSLKGEYANITYNVTQNITFNITQNVTYNITNNITTYVNNTFNITNNLTQNITYNITNNFTEYVNISYNITNNITYNVTQNITFNITQNVTYNITYNITNNITEYVNNTFNITNNITYNVTQNITFNITQNVTYNITYNITNNITVEFNYSSHLNQSLNTTSNVQFNNVTASNFLGNINASAVQNPPWLNASDQRYNDTVRINAVNSSVNIQSLGFNTTANLKSYFDSLYYSLGNPFGFLNVSGVVSAVGNWSADKSAYNTTAQLQTLFLSHSDQRFNDTTAINNVASNISALQSSNSSMTSRVSALESSNSSLFASNSSQASELSNLRSSNITIYALESADNSSLWNNKLNVSDQRYNYTTKIDNVNTTANIVSLGFNTTTQLDTRYQQGTERDTLWNITGSPYLYNDSGILYLNQTLLNVTIDSRAAGFTYNDHFDQDLNETSNVTFANMDVTGNITSSSINATATSYIGGLIICNNGTATIMTRNMTLAVSYGCTI